jgi:hypothetical protein
VGLLSTALRSAILAGKELHYTFTLSYPGGTKRYSFGPVSSTSLGNFEGKVLACDPIRMGSKDRNYALEPIEFCATIDDTDRYFARLIQSTNGLSIENAAAVVQLVSPPPVTTGEFNTLFTGVVEQYDWAGPTKYQLYMRVDDLAMRSPFPDVTIAASLFPYAHADARAESAPLLYGRWDSMGAGGWIPCLLVDTQSNTYVVCLGRAKAVNRVYVDGVYTTSGFTVTYPVIGGYQFTCIVFTASQGEAAVTVDADGYEATGDGTGAVIENPAEQLKHAASNFVLGRYASGNWLSTSSRLDTTHFTNAAAFLTARNHKGSRYFASAADQRMTGYELFSEWQLAHQCRGWWTGLGKIAVRFEDHGVTSVYPSIVLKWTAMLAEPRLRYETLQRINKVTLSYLRDERDGQYQQTLDVQDPALTRDAPDDLATPWAYAGAV